MGCFALKQTIILACMLNLALSLPLQAVAASRDTQQEEAQAVFEQLLAHTDNPVVAQLARESLKRLQAKTDNSVRNKKSALPEEPKAAVTVDAGKGIEIPISKLNEHPMVPVSVGNQVMANFLIDTGSTYTVISPELAQLMSVAYSETGEKATLITGNGLVKAPIVQIDKLRIGAYQISHVKAIIHSLGNQPYFSGLLGLNAFKNQEMTYKSDRIVLRPQTKTQSEDGAVSIR